MARPWTPDEVATLKRLRSAGEPAKRIVRHLPGRSRTAIARKAGEVCPQHRRRPAELAAAVPPLVRAGLMDCEIARRLGCTPPTVGVYRQAAGLAPALSIRERARLGWELKGPARQREHARRSFEARYRAEREANARDGWPLRAGRAVVAMLEALEGGSMTARVAAAVAGYAVHTAKRALRVAAKHGWVISPGPGSNRPYRLAPRVLARRRVRCVTCDAVAPATNSGEWRVWDSADFGTAGRVLRCPGCVKLYGRLKATA